MSRAEFIEVLKAEEDYRQGKITEEEITRLVKIGKLTPSEYKMLENVLDEIRDIVQNIKYLESKYDLNKYEEEDVVNGIKRDILRLERKVLSLLKENI